MTRPNKSTDLLIEQLAGELQPVRPLRVAEGAVLVGIASLLTLAAVAVLLGIRPEILAGHVAPIFVLANGLFFLLGIAAASSVVLMAMPYVGNRPEGWRWALAMAGLLPLAALVTAALQWRSGPQIFHPHDDLACILNGSLLGIVTGAALTLWLRRGAPTRPGRAGLLTGIASGAIGVAAYGFHCPVESIYHLGFAHAAPVAICALLGWAIVPRLVRW
jgi:hypothetical protein